MPSTFGINVIGTADNTAHVMFDMYLQINSLFFDFFEPVSVGTVGGQ